MVGSNPFEYDDKVSEREIILQVTIAHPEWTYKRIAQAKDEIMARYRKQRSQDDE